MQSGARAQRGSRRVLARWLASVLGLVVGAALIWPGAVQAAAGRTDENEDAEIVYLDPEGTIHVVDPRPISPILQVQWVSPEGGWTRIALGDVNGDGDAEIVAIRPEGDGGRLTIFDPVMTEVPAGHERIIAGVAWDVLYSMPLSGAPRLVVTGDFDPERPGDEILVSHFLPEEERSQGNHAARVSVLRRVSGREWETMSRYDSEFDWSRGASGNADGVGPDEVALIDHSEGNLSVFRVDESLASFYRNVTSSNPWSQAAFGQFTGGGAEELVAVRDAPLPLASFWVFRYEDNSMVDDRWEEFLPSPSVVFMGNLDGDDDDEAIMLRSVRQEVSGRPRLIVRDNGANPLRFEVLLDGDNGYQAGAAGDIDGDGHDEIAIMRDSRIRIYTEPETGSTFEEILTATNRQEIQLGNVDANGLGPQAQLGATESEVKFALQAGEVSVPVVVGVADVTTGETLPVTVDVEGESEWVEIDIAANRTQLPLSITVTLDSAGMDPGVYRDRIVVDAQGAGILNDPLFIDLELMVEIEVTVTPEIVLFDYYPCMGDLAMRSTSVALEGSEELRFSAALEGNPGWAAVKPSEGELPGDLMITVNPDLRKSDSVQADLLLTFDLPGAPGTVLRVPVVLLCAHSRLVLPFMATATP